MADPKNGPVRNYSGFLIQRRAFKREHARKVVEPRPFVWDWHWVVLKIPGQREVPNWFNYYGTKERTLQACRNYLKLANLRHQRTTQSNA